jgi:hypothetical protein
MKQKRKEKQLSEKIKINRIERARKIILAIISK